MRLMHFVVCCTLLCAGAAFAQTGDIIGIHDPSIARCGDTFYLYSTGHDVIVHTSLNLFTWQALAPALPSLPRWTEEYATPGNTPWAADVSFFNGRYFLYYAVSTFGKRRSAIGLATNATLDASRPDYRWDDQGRVIGTSEHDQWNAIDPCATTDADGHRWLVAGSCWSGIKLLQLNDATGLLLKPERPPLALAAHPPDNIIEEGYIRQHGNQYYLWTSVGYCCRGAESTYRILVGRSPTITGPYHDRDGRPLLEAGGTVVLASEGAARGPGSCAIAELSGRDYLVHHFYDADHHGRPTLAVRQLVWDSDGWPLAGEPLTRPPTAAATRPASPVGDWTVAIDFGHASRMTFHADGTITPAGHWATAGSNLTVHVTGLSGDVRCIWSDDGSWFAGRDAEGQQLRGLIIE